MREVIGNARRLALRLAGAASVALAITACGGGGGGATVAALPAPQAVKSAPVSGQMVQVTFHIVVPPAASARSRQTKYISSSTATASIKVNGGSAQTGACSSVSCNVAVDAPVGSDTFVVQLLDTSSNVLSQGSMTQTISATAANTVTIAFDGVPKNVTVSAATTNFVPGSLSSTSAITVTVTDAANDTIIGSDPYVDANGNLNPITLTKSDASAATSLTTTTLSSPATSTSTLQYTGASALAGSSIVLGATATSISVNTATVNVYNHHAIVEYTIPTSSSHPEGITTGPDGNVWFTESTGGNVGYVTRSGAFQEYAVSGGGRFYAITTGSDGNLWFTDSSNGKVDRVTTSGGITEFSAGVSEPDGIALGQNGSVFYVDFSSSGLVGQMTTSGSTSVSSAVSGTPQMQGAAIGPDHNIWFTEPFLGTQQFGAVVSNNTSFSLTLYNTTSNAQMRGITAGPDGNMWFCDGDNGTGGNNAVGSIHTDGTGFVEYPVPTSGGAPENIVSGSDGNLYFTEVSGNKIGRVTTAGAITEFSVPTSNAGPEGMANGPDGNIWFTEYTANKIGRFVL